MGVEAELGGSKEFDECGVFSPERGTDLGLIAGGGGRGMRFAFRDVRSGDGISGTYCRPLCDV